MYTSVHLDVSWESYSFELFDLPLDVPLVKGINQGIHGLCISVDSFDLRCKSVTCVFNIYTGMCNPFECSYYVVILNLRIPIKLGMSRFCQQNF